jgi:hypothetical protein
VSRPSKQQWEQARLAGQSARQNGRKRDQGPLYAMGRDGEILREAWQIGWDEADSERARRVKR